MSVGTYTIRAIHPPPDDLDEPLTPAQMKERGERRISEARAEIERCGREARAEVDRLYEAERTLTAEVARLKEENRDLRARVTGVGVAYVRAIHHPPQEV